MNRPLPKPVVGVAEQVVILFGLLLVGLAFALALQRQGPMFIAAGVVGLLVLVLAVRFPERMGAVVLVLGVFAAAYIQPVPLFSGPVAVSVLIFMCGLGVSLRTHFRFVAWPLALVGIGLSFLWMLGAVLNGRPTEGVALTGVATMAGVVQLGQTARGRRAALFGLAAGAVVASLFGIFTIVTGRNPIADYAAGQGQDLSVLDTTARFGLARAVGAFSHPIMLGTFLGLGCLAALELARLKAIRDRTAALIVIIAFVGQIATVSRGPIVATLGCVSLWVVFGRQMTTRWRVGITLGIVVLVAAALWVGGLQGDVGSLFGTSSSDPLAGSTRYRLELVKVLIQRLPHAPILGYPNPETAVFLPGFRSLDNEIAYLGLSRGLLGLAVFGALLAVPLVGVAVRRGPLVLSRQYVVLNVVFIIVVGAAVAYFGVLMFYLFVVFALCWLAVAVPSAEEGTATDDPPPE